MLSDSWKTEEQKARESIDHQISGLIAFIEVTGYQHKENISINVGVTEKKLQILESKLQHDVAKLLEVEQKVMVLLDYIPKSRLLVEVLEKLKEEISKNCEDFSNEIEIENPPVYPLKLELDPELIKMLTKQLALSVNMAKKEPIILFSDTGKVKNIMLRNMSEESNDSWNKKCDSNNSDLKNSMITIPQHSMIQSKRFSAELISFDSFNCFYVRLVDPKVFVEEQERLETEMQTYYGNPKSWKIFQNPKRGCSAAVPVDGIWRRCVITRIVSSQCEIFLVDIALHLTVKSEELKQLSGAFMKTKRAAVKCRLGDIAAKKEFRSRYPCQVEAEFQKMAKFKMEIYVLTVVQNDAAADVVVNFFPGNGKSINFNAMMVNKFDCAMSTGENSSERLMVTDVKVPKLDEEDKKMEIDEIIDPQLVQLEIQYRGDLALIERDESEKIDWKSGELCFVNTQIGPDSSWYRGKIVEAADSGIRVFLTDEELEIKVETEQLVPMDGYEDRKSVV